MSPRSDQRRFRRTSALTVASTARRWRSMKLKQLAGWIMNRHDIARSCNTWRLSCHGNDSGQPALRVASRGLLPDSSAAPVFRVADVKVKTQAKCAWPSTFQPGGRLVMRNVPMKVLVIFAYHVRPEAVIKAPGWIESTATTSSPKPAPNASHDDIRRMVQALLADRFNWLVHTDQKIGSRTR